MRYPRDLRSNPQAIASDVLVPLPNGGAVPLGEVAKVAPSRGPTSRPPPRPQSTFSAPNSGAMAG
jgi:Cu/Ag efflux pump CusA